jgi:hypothetical protein
MGPLLESERPRVGSVAVVSWLRPCAVLASAVALAVFITQGRRSQPRSSRCESSARLDIVQDDGSHRVVNLGSGDTSGVGDEEFHAVFGCGSRRSQVHFDLCVVTEVDMERVVLPIIAVEQRAEVLSVFDALKLHVNTSGYEYRS